MKSRAPHGSLFGRFEHHLFGPFNKWWGDVSGRNTGNLLEIG